MGVSSWVCHTQSFITVGFAEASLYQPEQTQETRGKKCARVHSIVSQSSPLSKKSNPSKIWSPQLLSYQEYDGQVTLPAVWVCPCSK